MVTHGFLTACEVQGVPAHPILHGPASYIHGVSRGGNCPRAQTCTLAPRSTQSTVPRDAGVGTTMWRLYCRGVAGTGDPQATHSRDATLQGGTSLPAGCTTLGMWLSCVGTALGSHMAQAKPAMTELLLSQDKAVPDLRVVAMPMPASLSMQGSAGAASSLLPGHLLQTALGLFPAGLAHGAPRSLHCTTPSAAAEPTCPWPRVVWCCLPVPAESKCPRHCKCTAAWAMRSKGKLSWRKMGLGIEPSPHLACRSHRCSRQPGQ